VFVNSRSIRQMFIVHRPPATVLDTACLYY